MSKSQDIRNVIAPSSEEYDDETLYGNRREARRLAEQTKQSKCSECVLFGIGLYADKKQWTIKNLIGTDKRTRSMADLRKIDFAYPLQRYCWPHIENGKFPLLCVAPELTGKTYSHILHSMTKCITDVPISRTDELISAADKLSCTFSTEQQVESDPVVDLENIAANIDQDNFDWGQLGKASNEHTGGPEGVNGENAEVETLTHTSSWFANGDNLDADEFRFHPKYIIVCSNQLNVDKIKDSLEDLKAAAYEDRLGPSTLRNLPPSIRSIQFSHDDQKLAARCNESDILVSTPGALIKCLGRKYIMFDKTRRVFFDDIDLTLQLHNSDVREIMKRYLDYLIEFSNKTECQLYFFSKKWTELVKHFVSEIFKQRMILFSSIIEASLYSKISFDLEVFDGNHSKPQIKLINILDLETAKGVKIAITCKSNEEAEKLTRSLKSDEYNVKFLSESNTYVDFKAKDLGSNPIYVLSDAAFEMIVDQLADIKLLIHYSIPEDWLAFDQRFRLMYKHIQNSEKGLKSIIFLRQGTDIEFAKRLYDVVSRSESTLGCTKTTLRDYINKHMTFFCWRWAAIGVCKLEKFIRSDRFGSYCQNRHTLISAKDDRHIAQNHRQWPTSGQFKISITHIVSPSEFYFRFEEHRDVESLKGRWTRLEKTGFADMHEFQAQLDKLKDTPSCSVPLENFKRGRVYGIYAPQEGRVDRVTLMEDISRDDIGAQAAVRPEELRNMFLKNPTMYSLRYSDQYSKQYLVKKTDYGVSLDVYLRNMFELPEDLKQAEPKCHRGFHVGVKPVGSEPYWTDKAKKLFHEHLSVENLSEVRVWLRLSNNNSFWFEDMHVMRQLINFEEDNQMIATDPYKELLRENLAEATSQAPSFCWPSSRVRTTQKWFSDSQALKANYAYLNVEDKLFLPILVQRVNKDLSLQVRIELFNKSLIGLENDLTAELEANKLTHQEYLEVGVYCLVKMGFQETVDRCRIIEVRGDNKFRIKCLDHGDEHIVDKDELFQIPDKYLTRLPFQSITCELDGLNPEIVKDIELRLKIEDKIYELTWDEQNSMRKTICFKENNKVRLYRLIDEGKFAKSIVVDIEEELGRGDLFCAELPRELVKIKCEEANDDSEEIDQVLGDRDRETKPESLDLVDRIEADHFLYIYIRNIIKTMAELEITASKQQDTA